MSIYEKENCYGTIHAYYALNLSEFNMKSHCHNQCEIMYLISGTNCRITIEDVSYELAENEFVFIDQNIKHSLYVEKGSPCSILNLEFTCSPTPADINLQEIGSKSLAFSKFIVGKHQSLLLHDTKKMGYALKDLISELEHREEDSTFMIHILFTRILLELGNCYSNDKKASGAIYLKKAGAYIQDHLYEELNVTAIAKYVGINHAYLQTLFSSQYHCGIIAYVNRLRMEHASFLLRNSRMSITDMAFYLGYNSRQHFGYTFLQHFKMSPQNYRRLHGQTIAIDTGGAQQMKDANGTFNPIPM